MIVLFCPISMSLVLVIHSPLLLALHGCDLPPHFGPFYYIQIDPQDYDEWRTTTPEEEIHFQTPSKFGSPTTP